MLQAVQARRFFRPSMTVLSLAAYSIPIFLVGVLGRVAVLGEVGATARASATGNLSRPDPVSTVGTGVARSCRWGVGLGGRIQPLHAIVDGRESGPGLRSLRRGQGAKRSRIMFRHVARNALGPIATQLGLFLPVLLAGTVITESSSTIRAWGCCSGTRRPRATIRSSWAWCSSLRCATVVGSLLADVGYAVLDPRIRYGRG